MVQRKRREEEEGVVGVFEVRAFGGRGGGMMVVNNFLVLELLLLVLGAILARRVQVFLPGRSLFRFLRVLLLVVIISSSSGMLMIVVVVHHDKTLLGRRHGRVFPREARG